MLHTSDCKCCSRQFKRSDLFPKLYDKPILTIQLVHTFHRNCFILAKRGWSTPESDQDSRSIQLFEDFKTMSHYWCGAGLLGNMVLKDVKAYCSAIRRGMPPTIYRWIFCPHATSQYVSASFCYKIISSRSVTQNCISAYGKSSVIGT